MFWRLVGIAIPAAFALHLAYSLGAARTREEAEAAAEEKYQARALEEARMAEEIRLYAARQTASPTVDAFLECGDLLGVDMQGLAARVIEDWEQEQFDIQAEGAARPDPR